MTQDGKSGSAGRTGEFSRVAIVGAATLKGREVAEVLSDRNFPALEVKLLDDEESLGQLEAVGDEMSFVQAASRDQFANIDIVFFASDAQFTRRTWQHAREVGALIVDLSYALEQEPGAQVRSPWVEQELSSELVFGSEESIQVVAHPAATTLALLLTRLGKKFPIEVAVANVFEPASELGRKGMDELHQQTVNLLSFQPIPKGVFDTQVAFNMLPRYGKDSRHSLQATEQRILDHYRQVTKRALSGREAVQHTIVADRSTARSARIDDSGSAAGPQPKGGAAMPSLALYQAPIFHSHVLSVFIELQRDVTEAEVAQVLAGEHVAIIGLEDEPPANVAAAGENEIQLAIRHDAARRDAVWLWAAADNLKLSSLTAVACAETALALKPKGRIQ
jgi:aspartate-semialdehyde dehydrogenase